MSYNNSGNNKNIGNILAAIGIVITVIIVYSTGLARDAAADIKISYNTSRVSSIEERVQHIDAIVIENNTILKILLNKNKK